MEHVLWARHHAPSLTKQDPVGLLGTKVFLCSLPLVYRKTLAS